MSSCPENCGCDSKRNGLIAMTLDKALSLTSTSVEVMRAKERVVDAAKRSLFGTLEQELITLAAAEAANVAP